MTQTKTAPHRVVIIGGGFGGLYAAKAFAKAPNIDVTLIDKRNFHLFQPLLYQVATGSLSPGEISSPLRMVLRNQKNTHVLLDEVRDIDPETKTVTLTEGSIAYDSLIVATGASHFYFGNDHWQKDAPGLKTIEDAIDIRRRIFEAFEAAEKTDDPAQREAWLTFAIVGAGPTGVEMAGAIAELAHKTLKHDFSHIDTTQAKILLIEGMDRVLPPYAPDLSAKAQESLEKLGVTIQPKSFVTNIDGDNLTIRCNDEDIHVSAKTTIWAAGIRASKLGRVLADRAGAELDRAGRVIVSPRLSLPTNDDIYVVGDLAHFAHQGSRPLPGVAPVAMQEGQYVATAIQKQLQGKEIADFTYVDFGSLAVIGQNEAVADLGFVRFSGFLAWIIWIVAHIYYLIEFDNKLLVMVQWGWSYLTRGRGARLITGEASLVPVKVKTADTEDGASPQLEKVEEKSVA
jgi:NADH:ubiquinone reductase (H+-translocating)